MTDARARFVATVQRRYGLTPREAEVLALTFAGVTSIAEQARRLGLAEQTVNNHRSAICAKLGRPTLLDVVVALVPQYARHDPTLTVTNFLRRDQE